MPYYRSVKIAGCRCKGAVTRVEMQGTKVVLWTDTTRGFMLILTKTGFIRRAADARRRGLNPRGLSDEYDRTDGANVIRELAHETVTIHWQVNQHQFGGYSYWGFVE